ncbi:MAG: FliM/FliN family flagellar motor switch protein [Parvularculaceae bacterium]
MSALEQAEVALTVTVGGALMPLSRLMNLTRGAVVSLGRDAKGPLAVEVNGVEIAKAGVLLIGDRIAVKLA